jgi:hypothetical protein
MCRPFRDLEQEGMNERTRSDEENHSEPLDEKEGLVRERSTKEAAAVIEACFPSHTSKVRNLHEKSSSSKGTSEHKLKQFEKL